MEQDLAPSDPAWHVLYAETMQTIFNSLSRLDSHPAAHDGEDLTDFVDMLLTLISFRPQTVPEIEKSVRAKMHEHL